MKEEQVYVLDCSAVLAYLNNEPEGARVEDLLRERKEKHGTEVHLMTVDYGRVYSICLTEEKREERDYLLKKLEDLPVNLVVINKKIAVEAARLFAEYPMSFPVFSDALCCALALISDGRVVTASASSFRGTEEVLSLVRVGKDGEK